MADTGSDALLAHFKNAVGVHLAENFSVVRETRFVHVDFKDALGHSNS